MHCRFYINHFSLICLRVSAACRIPSCHPARLSLRQVVHSAPRVLVCRQGIKKEDPSSSLFFHVYAFPTQQMSHRKRISEGHTGIRNIKEHIHSQAKTNLSASKTMTKAASSRSVLPFFGHPSLSLDSITMSSTRLRVLVQ